LALMLPVVAIRQQPPPSAPYRSGRTETWLKTKCYDESVYEVAGVLRESGRPAVAYMVTPDKERRYVGGAFITLNHKLRERLWARCRRRRASR
jgi:ATP-dependent DNA ligase